MEALQAFLLGGVAQSALILAGVIVYVVKVPSKVVGGIAGFGAGALVGAVAFDLVPEAEVIAHWETSLWLLIGAGVFLVAAQVIETKYGGDGQSGPLGIVVGSVVDGVPESIIFGIQIATGQVLSVAFLGAVWVSNIPQALAPSAALAESGWKSTKTALMWSMVVVACAVTALIGYFVGTALGANGGRAAALAAGGLLAMLTDSLMPYAFEKGGPMAGLWTVVGFALALAAT